MLYDSTMLSTPKMVGLHWLGNGFIYYTMDVYIYIYKLLSVSRIQLHQLLFYAVLMRCFHCEEIYLLPKAPGSVILNFIAIAYLLSAVCHGVMVTWLLWHQQWSYTSIASLH